jgi:hypothetical protein
MQPGILFGQHFGATVRDTSILGSSQAIGCLGTGEGGYGQGLGLDNVTLDGTDAPLVLYRQLEFSARRLNIRQTGLHGIRARGGDMSFDRVFIARIAPYTTSFVHGEAEADGQKFALSGFNFDNEGGIPLGPLFDFASGSQRRSMIGIARGSIAQGGGGAFLRLLGNAHNPAFPGSQVTVSAVDCSPLTGCAVQCDGLPVWTGRIDGTGLPTGVVMGPGAAGVAVTGAAVSLTP